MASGQKPNGVNARGSEAPSMADRISVLGYDKMRELRHSGLRAGIHLIIATIPIDSGSRAGMTALDLLTFIHHLK